MKFVDNDRWGGEFKAEALGRWVYTVVAWVDEWRSWSAGLRKKAEAGQEISVDALVGVELLQGGCGARREAWMRRSLTDAAAKLKEFAAKDRDAAVKLAGDPELAVLVNRNRDRAADTRYEKDLAVVVDPVKARFSTWYEMFPRSVHDGSEPARHVSGVASTGWGTSRVWDSTFCTCRRFIRSERRSGRERIIRRHRRRAIWEVLGRSVRKKAGTRRFIRNWGRWRTSRRLQRAAT